jgi:exodeoxyribonuclease VII large subunit
MAMLEERRKRSPPRACSTPARKRPLPFLPDVIGVVTSPTGAVIRDILHRLRDRFPRRVLVWPVRGAGRGRGRGRRRDPRLQRARAGRRRCRGRTC